MKNIFNQKFLSIAILSVAIITLPVLARAAIVTNTNPTELNDAVQLMVNVATWILGIVGSLALLMFVIGGFMFLISAGNSKTVEQGKGIIIGAVIGLLLVFSSYMIIQFSMSAMGLKWSGSTNAPTIISPVTTVAPADEACVQQYGAQGYSCMNNANGNNCKTGLCSGAASIQCCLSNTSPADEPCVQQFGTQNYSCMSNLNGHSCKTGLCSGGGNIQCCLAN